jgi:hypothetical protein
VTASFTAATAWAPAPSTPGFYLYREANWKRAQVAEVHAQSAIFTDAEGNNEREVALASLPGEWSGPVAP